jgi:hypothetical protein
VRCSSSSSSCFFTCESCEIDWFAVSKRKGKREKGRVLVCPFGEAIFGLGWELESWREELLWWDAFTVMNLKSLVGMLGHVQAPRRCQISKLEQAIQTEHSLE